METLTLTDQHQLNGTFPDAPPTIRIFSLKEELIPIYASHGAAGADLKASMEDDITLQPGERRLIPTGVSMEIPPGYEVQLRPRSGLALKHGITLLNSPATIDSDYRGMVQVLLINLGAEPFTITPLMRIAQMVIAKVEQASFIVSDPQMFSATTRGANGFGHTGTH